MGNLNGILAIDGFIENVNEIAIKLKRKIRILEVGAGTGRLTSQVVPRLKCDNLESHFTDIGNAFVLQAKKTFEEYPFMRYGVYDITELPINQGYDEGYFDIILAFNVVHTIPSVEDSLLALRSALNSSGSLYLMESCINDAWSTMSWGVLEGWWGFEDYHIRNSLMLNVNQWENVLNRCGFTTHIYPKAEELIKLSEKMFIIATKNDTIKKANKIKSLSKSTSKVEKMIEAPKKDNNQISKNRVIESTATKLNKLNLEIYDSNNVLNKEKLRNVVYQIWQQTLELDELGFDSNFYDLGGDSILAINLMEKVNKSLAINFEISDIFSYNNINSQTEHFYNILNERNLKEIDKNEELLIEEALKKLKNGEVDLENTLKKLGN
ncbi:MAG: methyltransferase [Flavobacteriaceae bacterium]|nr:methyltransferase [Flavobacteriaceae bacterium]